ncbi:isochorismate synthase [Corynebacterium sp. zg-331]|uniref:isochorismate synthase n=1 Tax=unclassified Corynebacterium TaxID=2624378 RepID=UPI00128C2B22|nr:MULTISPECIES: isochorismate synthase [unclassified Corynebacterium]MBC3185004.1 isochorismate synthase [Corynebacterium sp. zg-331]MPV51506.1 isochorismate synthase [Corynebacterium sp. zg331]
MPDAGAAEALDRGDLFFWHEGRVRYVPARALRPDTGEAWEPGAILAGAIPFDESGGTAPALWRAPRWQELPVRRPAPGDVLPEVRDLHPAAPTGDYLAAVRRAVSRLRAPDTDLHKVVLARAVTARLADEPVWGDLIDHLIRRNPAATVFSIPVPAEDVGRQVFFGASPELLLRKQGANVVSHPLAGSVPRSPDPEEDRRRAQGLLASAKDAHEHAFVVRMIAQALGPVCAQLDVPERPSLLATDTMWHLGTRMSGRLAPEHERCDALALARLLHPTPAVAGWPTDRALRVIAEMEPADRGLYAGAVGWVDAKGDGQWNVSIRCALLRGLQLTAWGGAGIVADSEAEAELRETAAKLRTIVTGLGVDAQPAEG